MTLEREIPEAPYNHQSTEEPEGKGEVGEQTRLDLRTAWEESEGNVTRAKPHHEDKK